MAGGLTLEQAMASGFTPPKATGMSLEDAQKAGFRLASAGMEDPTGMATPSQQVSAEQAAGPETKVGHWMRDALGMNPNARFSLGNLASNLTESAPAPNVPTVDPRTWTKEEARRNADPIANDPIAQGVIGGVMTAGTTEAIAPVRAVMGVTRALTPMRRVIGGGVGGAVGNKAQGGDLSTGFVLGGTGALLDPLGREILDSKGGRARALIEEKGGGAKAGLFNSGSGGVFDRELAGVSKDSAGEGLAAQMGSQGAVTKMEKDWSAETGQPDYRQSHKDFEDMARLAHSDALSRVPKPEPVDLHRLRLDANERARPVAEQKLSEIDQAHASNKARFGQQKAAAGEDAYDMDLAHGPVDATHVLDNINAASLDMEAHAAWPKLNEMKHVMEQRLSEDGRLLLSRREMNGLRKALSDTAKLGKSDVAGGAEAPLRKAAGAARDIVAETPFQQPNEFYAEAMKNYQAQREAAGLRKRPPPDRAVDVDRLARKVAAEDFEKSRAAAQQKFGQETADWVTKAQELEAQKQSKVAGFAEAKDKATPTRQAFGMNENIPTQQKADVDALSGTMARRASMDSQSAGRLVRGDSIEKFLEKNPEYAQFFDMPKLAAARNTLTFGTSAPGGSLISKMKSAVSHNMDPITGRVLYPLGKAMAGAKSPIQEGLAAMSMARDEEKRKNADRAASFGGR